MTYHIKFFISAYITIINLTLVNCIYWIRPQKGVCTVVSKRLKLEYKPGEIIHKYELVERSASLGVCGHTIKSRDQYSVSSDSGYNEVVPATDNEELDIDGILPGPSLEYQCLIEDIDIVYINDKYRLKKKFNGGSHGELWKASRKIGGNTDEKRFVMKRIFVERGEEMLQSGLREIYYGEMLKTEYHITRFVEYFYRKYTESGWVIIDDKCLRIQEKDELESVELWLVFQDEGLSMRNYLYSGRPSADSVVFEASDFWRRLRTDKDGDKVMKETMRQILTGLSKIHKKNITHRDIKPSNILVNNQESTTVVKLADFGSAVDTYALKHLYGEKGPTQGEETREYQPPEVIFENESPYDYRRPQSYDMWSVGVVFLELFLGTPEVFVIDSRARARLDHQLRGKDEQTKRKSYVLHALADFCIYRPTKYYRSMNDHALIPGGCNIGEFNRTLRRRDPLGIGFTDTWGLNLLWKLLQWSPKERISAQEALEHAYFKGPYTCNSTGRQFATNRELHLHMEYLKARHQLSERTPSFINRTDIPTQFRCPMCKRVFNSWDSCNSHLIARKHNRSFPFCEYTISILDNYNKMCFSSTMGYSLMRGRRGYMEDMIAIFKYTYFDVYAILDGHNGISCASYVKKMLSVVIQSNFYNPSVLFSSPKFMINLIIKQIFQDLQAGFIESASETSDFSGTTTTLAIHYKGNIIAANVGDSRAVICSSRLRSNVRNLTVDHTPDIPIERRRIESSGGFVRFYGVWRVVGELAVSRSIGDIHHRQYLDVEPSIKHLRIQNDDEYVVIASDGVWEVMSSSDVCTFVRAKSDEAIRKKNESVQEMLDRVASELCYEAYIRGSTDNIAALILSIGEAESSRSFL